MHVSFFLVEEEDWLFRHLWINKCKSWKIDCRSMLLLCMFLFFLLAEEEDWPFRHLWINKCKSWKIDCRSMLLLCMFLFYWQRKRIGSSDTCGSTNVKVGKLIVAQCSYCACFFFFLAEEEDWLFRHLWINKCNSWKIDCRSMLLLCMFLFFLAEEEDWLFRHLWINKCKLVFHERWRPFPQTSTRQMLHPQAN